MNGVLISILNWLNSLAAVLVIAAFVAAGLAAFSSHNEPTGLVLIIGGPLLAALLFGVTATLLDIRHQLVELNRKHARMIP